MNYLVLQKSAAGTAVRYSPLLFLSRLATRRKVFLRRKGPSWVELALLVLVADIVLAVFAWGVVGLVLN